MNDNLTTDELKSAELVLERWEQGYELHAGELVHRIEGLYAALHDCDRDLATARRELRTACPRCEGQGGGYVRTGPDDQWDSEECDWCWGAGYIPAPLAERLRVPLEPPAHTVSDRGFVQFDYIDLGEERRVRVYESSAASEAKVWLRLVDDEGMACTQLTLLQARQLADQLVWLAEHHHMAAVDGEAPAT